MNTLVREDRSNERGHGEKFTAPAASVIETRDGYKLQVDMPAVNKEGLEIFVENNELTITGRRSMANIDGTILHRESRAENYRRSFDLDPSIDTAKITARIDQGVVTLHLPKAEHVKPRRISVD
jgi:HSP20 family protein